ncbi:rubrerythrin [Candidatus Gastranaerophilales bacterium]|nr:MAG: rubrerythrin [Candidatus Gastranaerophilales bacterium]
MPEFATPYSVKRSERKLTNEELIRAIRFSIAGEYEAIQLYEEIAETIDNEEAKRLLNEIAGDERVHAGNLHYLLNLISPEDARGHKEGVEEAEKVIKGEKE